MVEHHRGVGHGPGELEHLGVLMVVVPRVVGEVAPAELSNALPERLVGEASWIGPPGNHQQLRFEGARQGVADALEQVAGCCLVLVEHLGELVAEGEVGVGDDAGDRSRPGMTTGQLGCLGGDELGLADRLQVARTVRSIARSALDEHRGDHVVARSGVCHERVDVVRQRSTFGPQVVMGIDDRQVRIDDRLGDLVEPFGGAGLHPVSLPPRSRPGCL